MNGIPPLSSRDAHASPPQRVLERLHSSAAGLDADEAARRLAAHGYNRLPAPKRQGPLLRLLRQFHNVLLYMMLFASLVTALLGFWVDSAVILLAVVVNALIGFVQEGKAANALDAIRDMLSLHALVLRDGQRQALDAERLVPGDVVLLASGDRVPADLRLFETKNFHVDESALTGESVPVEKGCVAVAVDALLGDRRCMAYYMLIQEDTPEAQVFGCWRILDTTGPYMLKNTFPELLHGKEAPCSPHIWELSRFAINSGQKGSLGFSDCTLEAMRALARYSLQNDIQTLVTVTTVGVEKMMIRAGLDVSRFGPHLKIGIERAVALRIELNAKTQIALYGGVLVEQRLAVS
ncbi:hypothetical protein AO901_33860 [Pseudomonas aeruginosa]|nr:hypothetical protein AO901_33860 [Pseudomonas aeruginosa]